MLERGKMDRNKIEFVDTEGLVPADHLLRKIDAAVDFTKIYKPCLIHSVQKTYDYEGRPRMVEYVYDEHFDCILCPEYQPLQYSTTNRDGYRE